MVRLFVFACGAILMSLEMLGSRFLAPQYGSSIIVWASLISVFMAGLAAGYWLGGVLADAWPSRRGVAAILAASGLLTTAVPLLAQPIFRLAGDDPRAGPLLAATLLFFLPTMLLGAVSPYAIRLHDVEQHTIGRTAGRLYALSTFGSIAGTIVTAFWLIPLAGIDHLAYGLGAALLFLCILVESSTVSARGAALRPARALAVVAGGVVLMLGGAVLAAEYVLPHIQPSDAAPGRRKILERDSYYHHIRLHDENGVRVLRLDRLVQTAMPLHDVLASSLPYTDYFHLAYALNPDAKDILLIGLGGGAMPKQFLHDYPGVRIDVAELDPQVVDIARRYFSLPSDSDRLHVYAEDGRRFLARTNKKYDLILIDAFQRDYIPFHLVTGEFFALCRSRLNANGMVGMNVISAMAGRASSPAASIDVTARSVFREHYAFMHDFGTMPARRHVRNCFLIFGMNEPLGDEQLFVRIEGAGGRGVRDVYLRRARNYVPGGPDPAKATMLSDRFAPVEDLLRPL